MKDDAAARMKDGAAMRARVRSIAHTGDRSGLQVALLSWYRTHGRADLPWRVARDPYYTLVSEFMLQQTQVERVAPKFEAFVRHFPDFAALARAPVADVLREWRGLGYNARAVRLCRIAKAVVERFDGVLPRDAEALRSLPGIGPYTVGAVRAFAFDEDDAACDVNVRRVVHRFCFGLEFPPKAAHAALDARARELVPPGEAHDWNSAMMDLGATICTARAPKCLLCPLRGCCKAAPIDAAQLETLRKRHARAPSPQAALKFEHTTRYARGRIVDHLRELAPGASISFGDLHERLRDRLGDRTADDVRTIVAALEREGLITIEGDALRLRE